MEKMDNTVIQLEHITKNYNIYKKNIQRVRGIFFGKEAAEVKHALRDVSLTINKGERVIVTGPVEAGCTSLLSIIAGVIYPTKGKIRTRGKVNAFLNMRAGFENEATCRENIYLKANVLGIPKAVIKNHVEEIIEELELKDYIDIPLKRAPKGTPLRICLAVHLLMDTDIMIIDENFNSGGVHIRQECIDKIQRYFETHPDVTLVISTSQLGMTNNVCTRGLFMEDGVITFDGTPREIYEKYRALSKRATQPNEEPDSSESSEGGDGMEEKDIEQE